MNLAQNKNELFDTLFQTSNKVALITGGASGMGLAASELFCAAGMNVYILDFNEELGIKEAERISSLELSGKCNFKKLDVTDKTLCETVIKEIAKETYEKIDILYNCAGLSIRDANMDEAMRDRLWKVNVDGTENVCEAVIPFMKKNSFGRIINMGSVVGYSHIEFPLGLLYKKSKERTHEYTLELSLKLATDGITVNALAPGRVLTALVTKPGAGWVALAPDSVEAFRNGCSTQSSGKMLMPEEVAMMALTLCSPLMCNVSGSVVDMTSGWGTAGHKPYSIENMPEAFYPFRDLAQTTTETKIAP
jgi:2-keto-3-deoxy-L-fuconate dehydrogenase